MTRRKEHWDRVWREREPTGVSWYRPEPGTSLAFIEEADPPAGARVLDVGGGVTTLAGALLERGFRPAVLDISREGLERARARLGERADEVEWIRADVTRFDPPRRWDVWHDRAVLHFLVEEVDREAYRRALLRALESGGVAVIATFAPEGPDRCSGLPVRRYGIEDLATWLAPELAAEAWTTEDHVTPSGSTQQFLVARFRVVDGRSNPVRERAP